MKLYLKKLSFVISLLLIVIFITLGIRQMITYSIDWKLPKEKTVAFMGASHIYRGIDANLQGYTENLSKPSERYLFTYIKLKKLVENNPQINTIILQCAPTDLWEHADNKYFVDNEMSEFAPLFYPMFDCEMVTDYKGHYLDMMTFIIQHMSDFRTYCSSYYMRKICYGQQNGALLTGVMDKESVKPDMIKGEYGNNINIKYLHKIIDYCNSYSLKLFLVYFPVYHPEYYYDQDYYYEQIGKIKTFRRNKIP